MNLFGCWEPFWKLRQEPYAGRDGTCLRWAYDERIERNNRIEQADDRLYPHSCASWMSYIAKSRNRKPHTTLSTAIAWSWPTSPAAWPAAERAVHPPLHPADGRSRKDRRLRAGTDERQYRRGIARHVAHACGAVHGRLTGGTVPPRLIDEHLVVIGGLLHDIGTYFLLKQDGSDGEPLNSTVRTMFSTAQRLRILAERGR